MAEIKLLNVSYLYSKNTPFQKEALKNVSVTFESGKITGLIGHTGSGKSTLAQLLNGLIRPESGTVLLDGRDIWEEEKEISKLRFKVGLVFQYPEYQLFEETVYKDIAFGPKNMGKTDEEIDAMVRDAAFFAGVDEELLQRSPFELSGGQKRKVAIAGVIAMQPDVLVLDEPAAGLDPRGREEILQRIKKYKEEKNKTIILISHSMEDMARYSDNICVMKGGTVLLYGTVDEVFKNSDLLESSGLLLPQITKLMIGLKNNGVDVNTGVYTVKAAYEELLLKIGNKK